MLDSQLRLISTRGLRDVGLSEFYTGYRENIMDDDELDFPFSGPTRFEGLELPQHLNCNPRALREGYLEAVGDFLDNLRRNCARNTIDYALIRTSQPLDAAIATYLSNRLGMHHRN